MLTMLAGCGGGDGPAGASRHPVLGSCTSSEANVVYKCKEFRNITDSAWPWLGCENFEEDATCDNKRKVRGICRTTDSQGMTTTEWFYDCGPSTHVGDCAKQPSTIQASCQGAGGTYIPPDEAG
jgi:hypothetical protein